MNEVGRIIIQVHECISCGAVFQVHSTGISWTKYPFYQKNNTIHRAHRAIKEVEAD